MTKCFIRKSIVYRLNGMLLSPKLGLFMHKFHSMKQAAILSITDQINGLTYVAKMKQEEPI